MELYFEDWSLCSALLYRWERNAYKEILNEGGSCAVAGGGCYAMTEGGIALENRLCRNSITCINDRVIKAIVVKKTQLWYLQHDNSLSCFGG